MHATGIICEYNPLHLGHKKQLDLIRSRQSAEDRIVCLMSGNFVQRGHPAILDKQVRAKAAIDCGADLVLELPVTAALSSAEGFAAKGVEILSRLCDSLCFGAETPDSQVLMTTAQALLSDRFPPALREQLERGLSFPAARSAALAQLGFDAAVLEQPNNILAIEYCKAILSQNSPLVPMPILRQGSYHDTAPDPENPSATAVRRLMLEGNGWLPFVPQPAVAADALHSLHWGEKAMLYRLRTMTDAEFEALPYGSEGLWRKLMHACREQNTLEDILTATKSKRYTRTRLDRMVMCAFLGLTAADMEAPIPYVRVLAFNDKGRELLNRVREQEFFFNAGQQLAHPYQAIENRCGNLYGLFAQGSETPLRTENERVYYAKSSSSESEG